jgi:nitrous oxidase accessory protein NosD
MIKILPLVLAGAALFLSAPAYALSCGDVVMASVTLTSDLICTDSNGLTVGASGITIDLNGHTISCVGAPGGFLGSCQPTIAGTNRVGIGSTGHNAVTVQGPGTITGFEVGVRLANGTGLQAIGLTITGPQPSIDFPASRRLLTVGVLVNTTSCQFSFFAPSNTAVVEFNDISEQTQGVQLDAANCVVVAGNYIHDNAGFADTHGIDLISSSNNLILTNQVLRTGLNASHPGNGIQVFNASNGGNSGFNDLQFNYVTDNCGDGIALLSGAHNNNVAANFALNNATNPKCAEAGFGFWDLDGATQGTGNAWNPNNVCKTAGPGVPAGVCP